MLGKAFTASFFCLKPGGAGGLDLTIAVLKCHASSLHQLNHVVNRESYLKHCSEIVLPCNCP